VSTSYWNCIYSIYGNFQLRSFSNKALLSIVTANCYNSLNISNSDLIAFAMATLDPEVLVKVVDNRCTNNSKKTVSYLSMLSSRSLPRKLLHYGAVHMYIFILLLLLLLLKLFYYYYRLHPQKQQQQQEDTEQRNTDIEFIMEADGSSQGII